MAVGAMMDGTVAASERGVGLIVRRIPCVRAATTRFSWNHVIFRVVLHGSGKINENGDN